MITKKLFLASIVVSLLLSISLFGFASADDRPLIELEGTNIKTAAYISEGNVYLPLRAVSESLGYQILWSKSDDTISISGDEKNIMIDFKNSTITANDHTYYSGDYLENPFDGGTARENVTYLGADFFADNLGLEVLPDKEKGKMILKRIRGNNISIKTLREASETDLLKLTLQYPEIEGLNDQAVQESINSIFGKSAEDARNEGLKNADEMKKIQDSEYTGSPNKCETYFDYMPKYNQNGLLSMILSDYQYTGGAHGSTLQSSYTLSLKTGQVYELKDLFKSDVDYVSLINDTIRNEIDQKVKEGGLSEITPFETIKDDQDFYLSNNAVVIYFQQYEYFPYAAGIQEFPIDFSVLKDMLKPELSFLNND